MDQGQAIAALGLVEIGRGDEDRHLFPQKLIEDPPEVAARDGIDAVGRLVQKEHPRRMHQRAGQAKLLLHSTGEVAGQPAFEGREIAEGQQPPDPLVAALAGDIIDVGVEIDVFHHGQVGVESETLAHVADFGLDRLGRVHDVMSGHPGRAPVGVHDRSQQPHGRRLAGTVRSDEAEDLAFLDGQRKVVQRGKTVKALGEVFGANHAEEIRNAN